MGPSHDRTARLNRTGAAQRRPGKEPAMRKTFEIITDTKKLIDFTATLRRRRKKYSVTPWSSSDGTETGFVVWYYI